MPRKKKTETEVAVSKAAPKAKKTATAKAAAPKVPKTAAKKPGRPKKTETAKAVKTLSASTKAHSKGESSWKRLPRQGETQMVAFIRDPHCLFTYWEVTPQRVEEVKRELMGEYQHSSMVLRVFRTGVDGRTELIQEIRVEPGEMNRYVQLKEGASGSYYFEIAQKTPSGKTLVYVRSNKIMAGSSFDLQGAKTAAEGHWETPAGILEYFAQEETESLVTGRGVSSAEAQRRLLQRKRLDRYSASRIN